MTKLYFFFLNSLPSGWPPDPGPPKTAPPGTPETAPFLTPRGGQKRALFGGPGGVSGGGRPGGSILADLTPLRGPESQKSQTPVRPT